VLVTAGRKPRITFLLTQGDLTSATCNISGRIIADPF
jgi:hypothetical protein